MKEYLLNIFDLKENSDFEKTRATISEGVSLRGYNLWILVCSSLLACIGLDTNSVAVIIGAMLISPLMSPILGVGLSMAIHDKRLLIRSVTNLGIAVLISLAASVLYFILTPLGDVTPELQARTYPTLLDVLVALFGGIAGIVSISRNYQTNAIPGVAIATALMPPLCTSGFGIATMQWNYFLGAFYLFFINAVFISLTTYLIVRLLDFPQKQSLNKRLEKTYSRWFAFLSLVVLIPSIYFLYTIYEKELVDDEIDELVITPIKNHGNEIIKWEVDNKDTVMWIKVYHSGAPLQDSFKKAIDSSLHKNKLTMYKLKPMRVNLTKEEVSKLSAEMSRQMFQEMHLQEIKEESSLKLPVIDTLPYTQVFKEAKVAFPFIDTLSNGWVTLPDTANRVDTFPVVFYKTSKPINKRQTTLLYNYLVTRFLKDTVILLKRQ